MDLKELKEIASDKQHKSETLNKLVYEINLMTEFIEYENGQNKKQKLTLKTFPDSISNLFTEELNNTVLAVVDEFFKKEIENRIALVKDVIDSF